MATLSMSGHHSSEMATLAMSGHHYSRQCGQRADTPLPKRPAEILLVPALVGREGHFLSQNDGGASRRPRARCGPRVALAPACARAATVPPVADSTAALSARYVRCAPQAASGRVFQFKLVLLGDSAVGKSSLVLRFVRGQFFEYQESTIGGDKSWASCWARRPQLHHCVYMKR